MTRSGTSAVARSIITRRQGDGSVGRAACGPGGAHRDGPRTVPAATERIQIVASTSKVSARGLLIQHPPRRGHRGDQSVLGLLIDRLPDPGYAVRAVGHR